MIATMFLLVSCIITTITINGMHRDTTYPLYNKSFGPALKESVSQIETGLDWLHKYKVIDNEYHNLKLFTHAIAQEWDKEFTSEQDERVTFKKLFNALQEIHSTQGSTKLLANIEQAKLLSILSKELVAFSQEIRTVNLKGYLGYRSTKFPFLNPIVEPQAFDQKHKRPKNNSMFEHDLVNDQIPVETKSKCLTIVTTYRNSIDG